MTKMKKHGAVYGIIALMLCLAVYLNWSYVKSPDDLVVADHLEGTGEMYGDSALVAGTANTEDGGKTEGKAEEMNGEKDDDKTAETTSAAAKSGEDYFAQSRLNREKARDEAISILKETIANDKADEKSKADAGAEISKLAECSVTEAKIESLIKAKGYAEAVVFLGEDSANVIVQPPKAGFTTADAAKICDITVAETALTADKIKIVEAGA